MISKIFLDNFTGRRSPVCWNLVDMVQGSPFEYDMIRMLYLEKRKLDIAK